MWRGDKIAARNSHWNNRFGFSCAAFRLLKLTPSPAKIGMPATTALLDVDQLRTFVAIAETGSFTKAAEVVNKTQSAVSMQMKRLEERLERADFRPRRPRFQAYRRRPAPARLCPANHRSSTSRPLPPSPTPNCPGRVRLGVPDDYADRYLPEIMARFSRAYPSVELSVICEPSVDLLRAHRRQRDRSRHRHQLRDPSAPSETFRRERLLWVTSNRHATHSESGCRWRSGGRPVAGGALPSTGWRPWRGPTAFSIRARMPARSPPPCSRGFAVSVLPESSLRPGMRVLTAGRWFPGIAELPYRPGAQRP